MSSSPPRLMFVGSFDDGGTVRGGINTQCRYLLDSSFSDGIEILPLDSTTTQLPPPPLPVRAWQALRRLARGVDMLWRKRPDALMVFSSGGLSFLEKSVLVRLACFKGVPVIWSVRSGVFRTQVRRSSAFAWYARSSLRCARVLCQSESWRRFFQEEIGLDARHLFVQPNWIRPERFRVERPGEAPVEGSLRVLYVGWVMKAKGVFDLVEPVLSSPRLRRVRLDIVGEGEDFDRLEKMVGEEDLGRRVTLHGWQPAEAMPEHYRAADVLVLPSHAEGFPNVVLEAMAAGLPVVATPVGAVPEVVEDGVHGFHVGIGDREGLVDILERLSDDVEVRRAMGVRNRDHARRFGVEAAASHLRQHLSEIAPIFGRGAASTARRPAERS